MKLISSVLNRFGGLVGYVVLIVSVLGLTGCSPSALIRSDPEPCRIARAMEISTKCEKAEHIEVLDSKQPSHGYSLQFVEIDEQGFFHNPGQADNAIKFARTPPKSGKARIYYVVFVHGWFHGPEMSDSHLPNFLRALEDLSRWRPNGDVRGIYIGWRGNSLDLPLLRYLTFWDRKNVSEEVGRGSLQEFLLQLETAIRDNGKQNKLVTIGHSFGASVVFNALSHTLVQRFIDGAPTSESKSATAKPRGYGDLVVLINPAFEAMRFLPIYSMVNRFTVAQKSEASPRIMEFDKPGRPYFVVLSSEGDLATQIAFPIGRFFSTIWENHRDKIDDSGRDGGQKLSGWNLDRDTIGNFEKFASFKKLERASGNIAPGGITTECPLVEQDFWKKLSKNLSAEGSSSAPFPGTDFILKESSGRGKSPFLLTAVDKSIIENHSDIGKMDLACWFVQLADD